MTRRDKNLVALVGQPNCGKSTIFNVLTGARQRVANWPGVTVDKMYGWCRTGHRRTKVVDLPGTYGLTSSSPEELVTRDFLFQENPSFVFNVVDASNLRQGLTLTLQLLEMGVPVVVNLNMMDVAKKRGFEIDSAMLEKSLGVPVVATSMKTGDGRKTLLRAVSDPPDRSEKKEALNHPGYDYMEVVLQETVKMLSPNRESNTAYPLRWLAVKLMEKDDVAERILRRDYTDAEKVLAFVRENRNRFEERFGKSPEIHIAEKRHQAARAAAEACVKRTASARQSLSDRIDRIVCNRFAGPFILLAVMYLLYYLSIVQGYKLTAYTWPFLARLRDLAEVITPEPGFIDIPIARAFTLWFMDSVNALLNYIPIFFILFGLIAILEDSGYMPRMAFIMDRVLHRFGLHGQSVLPMILGGIYVGGCAVPAVMSSKGIPDERSRFATILTIPMLNCLAKVPIYILLVNAYFASQKGFAMFFISTVSLFLVLSVAKVLTLTVLKKKETAPFVMEMPAYHVPSVRGVLVKIMERLWLFLRKITTIVAAVAVVVFALLQFPGLKEGRTAYFTAEKDRLVDEFFVGLAGNRYGSALGKDSLMPLIFYWESYKKARMASRGEAETSAVNTRFREKNPLFYPLAQPGGDPAAIKANRALRKLTREREGLLMEMRKERLESSLLGRVGKVLEPFTLWAGFDWRVNVALLSALAAKESSVATLGAIYEQDEGRTSLEDRIASKKTGLTPLHALALILFMVFYPPCVATAIAVKVQTGSTGWMLFSIGYPMILGFASAVLIFTLGGALGLSGVQAMAAFYGLALIMTFFAGYVQRKSESEKGLLSLPGEEGAWRVPENLKLKGE